MPDVLGLVSLALATAILSVGAVLIAANEPRVQALLIDHVGAPLLRLLQQAGIMREP